MKTIKDLTLLSTLRNADEIIVRNSASGETSRVTLASLFAIFGGVVTSDYQLLWGVVANAQAAGSRITFERAFADADYILIPFAQSDDAIVTVSVGTVANGTKAASYIDVFPAVDDTDVAWIAIGAKVA